MRLLLEKIRQMQNPTVVGLDPTLALIPQPIKDEAFTQLGETAQGAAQAFLTFNRGVIDAVCDIVPAVKPQCAYYEALGWEGMRCLSETILYARGKGVYVITDGKRNDIGSTMSAYAAAHLGETMVGQTPVKGFAGHALTVNAYLGSDGIDPLLRILQKNGDAGIFVLVKTSNPSSGELQDRPLGEKSVYQVMGEMVEKWGAQTALQDGYSQVGAVVGATYPEQLQELRKTLPHTFFLVPGYGAQGGKAEDVAAAFDGRGAGAIVNSSRGILGAWQGKGNNRPWSDWVRQAALDMRDDLRRALANRLVR